LPSGLGRSPIPTWCLVQSTWCKALDRRNDREGRLRIVSVNVTFALLGIVAVTEYGPTIALAVKIDDFAMPLAPVVATQV